MNRGGLLMSVTLGQAIAHRHHFRQTQEGACQTRFRPRSFGRENSVNLCAIPEFVFGGGVGQAANRT